MNALKLRVHKAALPNSIAHGDMLVLVPQTQPKAEGTGYHVAYIYWMESGDLPVGARVLLHPWEITELRDPPFLTDDEAAAWLPHFFQHNPDA